MVSFYTNPYTHGYLTADVSLLEQFRHFYFNVEQFRVHKVYIL
jgi:hypothetical protein